MTRSLIVSTCMSLDGYVGADDPEAMFRVLGADPAAFNAYNAERLRSASTLLVGRRSFEMFEGYWPPLEADEDADPVEREISGHNNRVEKVVVSDSLRVADDSPWAASTRVVGRADAVAEAERLRRDEAGVGGDVLTFGSATTWNALLRAGVVDELHLMVAPVAIGSGHPAFHDGNDPAGAGLRLADVRRFDGSDNLVLVYVARR